MKQLKVGDKFCWGREFPTFTVVDIAKLGRPLNLNRDYLGRGPKVGDNLVLISETYKFPSGSETYHRVLILDAGDYKELRYQKHYKGITAARKYYLSLKTKGEGE